MTYQADCGLVLDSDSTSLPDHAHDHYYYIIGTLAQDYQDLTTSKTTIQEDGATQLPDQAEVDYAAEIHAVTGPRGNVEAHVPASVRAEDDVPTRPAPPDDEPKGDRHHRLVTDSDTTTRPPDDVHLRALDGS